VAEDICDLFFADIIAALQDAIRMDGVIQSGGVDLPEDVSNKWKTSLEGQLKYWRHGARVLAQDLPGFFKEFPSHPLASLEIFNSDAWRQHCTR
jgi:hypothetical protein